MFFQLPNEALKVKRNILELAKPCVVNYSVVDRNKGVILMSTREIAQNIFDSLTEEQLNTFITLFKAHETPNAETINAINEIESGGGTLFTGTTDELFSKLM